MFKRAIVGPFGGIGETAGGKLPAFEMVLQAFAAVPFPGTGFIRAIAVLFVLCLFAFHENTLFCY